MLGLLLPQDPYEHGELFPPPSFISWGSQDLPPLTLILLGTFPLSLFGALLRACFMLGAGDTTDRTWLSSWRGQAGKASWRKRCLSEG